MITLNIPDKSKNHHSLHLSPSSSKPPPRKCNATENCLALNIKSLSITKGASTEVNMRVRLLKDGLPKSGICTTKILRDNEAAKQRHPTFIGHVIRLKYEKPKGSSHPRWL